MLFFNESETEEKTVLLHTIILSWNPEKQHFSTPKHLLKVILQVRLRGYIIVFEKNQLNFKQ